MSKALYIAEKPSVAQEFAKALKINGQRRDGYLESQDSVVTWCVGHLVTMSYPEKYDIKYKRWSLDTLPFLPREFKYEVIPGVQKQFEIVKGLPFTCVPTPDVRGNTFTVWWHRWQVFMEKKKRGSGSTLRQKKKL
jgi:hypothetical protein